MKQTIIFPHVPKAGGTSIKVQLEHSGLRVLMDYKAPPGDTPWHRERQAIWARRLKRIDLSSYDLVFGHFPVTRYLAPQFRYVALVRDPVDRAVSQYFYHIHRSKLGAVKHGRMRFYQALASGRIGFIEYCKRVNLDSIYQRHLERWDRDRFVLVGDTSNYGQFVEGFNRLLGTKLTDTTHLRKREETAGEVAEEDIDQLRALLKDEIDWYRRFVPERRSAG